MQFDNYELTTLDYALRYYLKENPNLDEEDVEWCNLVRERVDSVILSQANYEKECGQTNELRTTQSKYGV